MKQLTRRGFFKVGGAGAAGIAASQMLGSRALASTSSANVFTVAVIPDTQNYCDASNTTLYIQPFNAQIFQTQMQYLADNKLNLNLAFVTHVGDVVQRGDGLNVYGSQANMSSYSSRNLTMAQNTEWLNAQKAIDVLSSTGVPFGLVPGNHDYDNMYHNSGNTYYPPLLSTAPWWKGYFGSQSKYFKGKSWYVGASDEVGYVSTGVASGKTPNGEYPPAGTLCNSGLTSAQIFSAGGKKFLHISLEMEASDAAIGWAQGVINDHLGYATIVTTHSFLSPPNWGDNTPLLKGNLARNSASYLTNSPGGWNGADNIFEKLIYPNAQIFMVLCGHSWTSSESVATPTGSVPNVSKGEYVRIDYHSDGSPVYQVLSDYQGNLSLGSAGGDGWYRFMQFDLTNNNIHFYTLNPWSLSNGQPTLAGQSVVYKDGMSSFDQPQSFSDFSLGLPAQVLNAPRGAH